MNPIEIAKNRCPKIGLSETELKGALFFLAGINSFARLDADDSERNKLFDYWLNGNENTQCFKKNCEHFSRKIVRIFR